MEGKKSSSNNTNNIIIKNGVAIIANVIFTHSHASVSPDRI